MELLRWVGRPSSYGLLGAEFAPLAGDRLGIRVLAALQEGEEIPWALPRGQDRVVGGIPPWSARSILDGAASNAHLRSLGPGLLTFECGAHAAVGSSPAVFRRLSGAISELVSRAPGSLTDEDSADIVYGGGAAAPHRRLPLELRRGTVLASDGASEPGSTVGGRYRWGSSPRARRML